MSLLPKSVDVVVIGAGQAGLSLSRCLHTAGVEHLVLERHRVADSWRSQRWDSFCLVTPNWSVRLAQQAYAGDDPDGFMSGESVFNYLNAYAQQTRAAISCGVEVMRVTPNPQGWTIATQCGQQIRTRVVVVATATHQSPKLPELAHQCQNVVQVHASAYRSPAMLPTGRTLVVGSGQSGMQIALELRSAGREVLLATSQVGRVPRRYRGQDIIAWQAAIGFLDRHHSELESAAARFAPDPQLSGANGGQTLDLRDFAARGISLAGRLAEVRDNRLTFSDDLLPNIHYADAFSKRIADRVDAHIDHLPKAVRADVPAPEAVVASAPMPGAVVDAALGDGEIESIVWATGFRHDFSWIEAEAVFDEFGYPRQSLGRTVAPGLHFAGLNYVEHRRSGILYGAGVEATQLAEVITSDLCATALAP